MSSWEVEYKGHSIRVENTMFSGERLIVDREIQDETLGAGTRSRLYGRIRSGDGAGEKVKVSLGGMITVGCRIFIDDKLVFPK